MPSITQALFKALRDKFSASAVGKACVLSTIRAHQAKEHHMVKAVFLIGLAEAVNSDRAIFIDQPMMARGFCVAISIRKRFRRLSPFGDCIPKGLAPSSPTSQTQETGAFTGWLERGSQNGDVSSPHLVAVPTVRQRPSSSWYPRSVFQPLPPARADTERFCTASRLQSHDLSGATLS